MKREYGEIPSLECRRESNEQVDRNKRYRQILECLEIRDMTAREVASMMCLKGYTQSAERNWSAPRLTELCEKGLVEQKGKVICPFSHKTVTLYGLVTRES